MKKVRPPPFMLDTLEIQARREASEAIDTFAMQRSRQAQESVLLDTHRAVTLFPGGFLMGWEHSSWCNQ